jgi:hypothetical protein
MSVGFRRTGLRLGLLGLLVASVMVTALLAGSAAAAGDVTCTGGSTNPLTGKIAANVVVPAGASCRIHGTVSGNVTALAGAQVGIRSGSTIRGNYTCTSCTFADLHGSTIGGNVVIRGETDGSFIDGSTIKGNLQIDSSNSVAANEDAFSIGTAELPNKIGGNLLFTNNTGGPSTIVNNAIAGYLTCQNNAPAPASSGNTAESFRGQCAA